MKKTLLSEKKKKEKKTVRESIRVDSVNSLTLPST